MPQPTLVVQISDPHLSASMPEREAGLRAAVERIAALSPAPVAVLLTGDIADNGAPEEYARAQELLAPLPMPVHALPGNKDDRAALRAAFGVPGDGDDEVRYAVDAGPLRLVLCDTQVPGELGGRIDADWVAATLTEVTGRPAILAMHHPPFPIGVAALDAIGLREPDRTRFWSTLSVSTHVLRVVAGHVHRPALAQFAGRTCCTAPSLSFQLALNFGSGEMGLADEAPGFLIHALTADGDLSSHVVPL